MDRYRRWVPGRKVWALLGLMAGWPEIAAAQDQEDFQIWGALLGSGAAAPEAPSLALWLDVHARRGDAGTVHILRPGLGVNLLPFLSVYAGYAWVPVFSDATGDAVHEHRIWEQVILQHQTAFRLSLQSRTRFEQRFSRAGSDVGYRLRQFVRIGWQPDADLPLGLVVWDELFLGLNRTDWGAPSGFDQNRLFAGLFLAMAGWARFEAGYLPVYIDRPGGDRLDHVFALNLFVTLRP